MKLLKFTSKTCSPYKTAAPIVEQFCEEHGLTLETYDIEENSDMTTKYNIRSVPTVILINNNEEQIGSVIGYSFSYRDNLEKMIKTK